MAKFKHKKSKKIKKNKSFILPQINTVQIAPEIVSEKDIPVYDFSSEYDLNTDSGLDECINYFNINLHRGYFHIWETVIKREKNMSLSEQQKKLLKELLNFSDKDGTILYVNEMPRPSEPWYETVRKIVAKLIVEPFKTYEIYSDIYHEGWLEIEHFVNNDASGLSLPEGVSSPIKVIPPDIRHKLWLQECFDSLSGLGQNDELTLEDKKQTFWKVESFIRSLKEQKESIEYFNLTVEDLLKLVILPPKDEKILIESLLQELGMKSVSDRLSDVL